MKQSKCKQDPITKINRGKNAIVLEELKQNTILHPKKIQIRKMEKTVKHVNQARDS